MNRSRYATSLKSGRIALSRLDLPRLVRVYGREVAVEVVRQLTRPKRAG